MTSTMRPDRLFRGVYAWLFCLMFSLPMLAQAPPSADTFVSSATPKTNYGPSITLIVGQGSTAYIQFNLSGVPTGATVSKAMLRLYVDSVLTSGSFDVYQLNGSWSESKLTYNTPPPALGTSATGGHPISITSASFNQFLLIDITSLVQGWVNGTIANNGVALALTGSTGYFSFDSKESLLTGNGPELEISLAGAVGPQGPQGIQGSAGPQGAQGPAGPQGQTGATGATGPAGPQGQMGLTGPQGPQGDVGPQGPAGANGVGFNFRNAFDNSASYAINDVVSYNGSSYVAIAATNPGDPTPDLNPNWSLIAQQGAAGSAGAPGATGAPGPQGPAGAQGSQGPAGPQGPPGPPGAPAGSSCPSGSFVSGFTTSGTLVCAEETSLLSAPVIVFRSRLVTAGSYGYATIVGTPQNQYLCQTNPGILITNGSSGVFASDGTALLTLLANDTATLSCSQTDGVRTSSLVTAQILVDPPPFTPAIQAPSSVPAGSPVNAFVSIRFGFSHLWTVYADTVSYYTGDAITFLAGSPGKMYVTCVEVDSFDGASSTPSVVVITST